MPFAHLHVASSSSMRYGASSPAALVKAAAADGQGILGLTDRDGLYGAVRFVRAATAAGIDPVLGVDLALDEGAARALLHPGAPHRLDANGNGNGGGDGGGLGALGVGMPAGAARTRGPRTPVRGGALVDDRAPRVVVLARGAGAGVAPGRGWAALCRLVTAAHLSSAERGKPLVTPGMLADAVGEEVRVGGAAPSPLLVLLGPDSDVGRTILDRPDRARELLLRWRDLLGESLSSR